MHLQTKIPLQPINYQIDYDSKIFLMGSCFAQHLAGKLEYHKFQNLSNPFGIIFHPVALARCFEWAKAGKVFVKEDLVYSQERWHSLFAHSDLSGPDAQNVVDMLNTAVAETQHYLKSASHIIITLGTAWGYRYKKSGELVANCHKLPQSNFTKELAGTAEIVEALKQLVGCAFQLNKNASVLFTVSPVRHLKDGFVQNQRSKAHLIAAVHEVVDASEGAHYFPSYELMMDELRDYRFYDRDMLHPSAVAIDYIWERFAEVALSPQAQIFSQKIVEIRKGLDHRPFNPNSDQHKKFITALEQKMQQLQMIFPHLRF